MSKVYPSIQGCPFRKVVEREYQGNGIHVEILDCGHKHSTYNNAPAGTKRRCYTCKSEAQHAVK